MSRARRVHFVNKQSRRNRNKKRLLAHPPLYTYFSRRTLFFFFALPRASIKNTRMRETRRTLVRVYICRRSKRKKKKSGGRQVRKIFIAAYARLHAWSRANVCVYICERARITMNQEKDRRASADLRADILDARRYEETILLPGDASV